MAFGHVIRILILILDLQNLFLKKELQFFFFLQMSFTKRMEYKKKILYIGMKKINLFNDFKNEILFEMNLCTIFQFLAHYLLFLGV